MNESIREQIVENLVTTLGTIKKDNGYFNTVGKISRNLSESSSINEYPALFVFEDLEEIEKAIDVGSKSFLTIEIYVFVEDTTDLKKQMNRMIADVKKALLTDRTRNDLAIDTWIPLVRNRGETLTIEGSCLLQVVIEYRLQKAFSQ